MHIYLNVCKQMTGIELLLLYNNTWNHLTAFNQISLISFLNISYLHSFKMLLTST